MLCTCKDVSEQSPSESIESRFGSVEELLAQLNTYYPEQLSNLGITKDSFLARGRDAYTFHVYDNVFKFTQNRLHAKVSWQLKKLKTKGKKFKHIVEVYNVAKLPDLKLWFIQEEPLRGLSPGYKAVLKKYFLEGVSISDEVDSQILGIISDLSDLGIYEWQRDCVAYHNILQDKATDTLKLFDFGYTHSHFIQDYPVWT